MDVSIIIVNYNTRDLLIQCIESIYKHTSEVIFEIIVVDNASIDDSCVVLKNAFSEVKLIQSDQNLGFGKANNLGVKYALGKYLFFLNSDTILIKNSVSKFFVFNELNNSKLKLGITGALLVDTSNSITGSFGPLPNVSDLIKATFGLLPRFTSMSNLQVLNLKKNKFLEVGYVMGADMFISKCNFELVNGFDENFFMYYEESDLQSRLKFQKFKNFIIHDAEIIHLEGRSVSNISVSNVKRIMYTKSMLYYFKKHLSKFEFTLLKYFYFSVRFFTVFDKKYTSSEKIIYLKEILKG